MYTVLVIILLLLQKCHVMNINSNGNSGILLTLKLPRVQARFILGKVEKVLVDLHQLDIQVMMDLMDILVVMVLIIMVIPVQIYLPHNQ